MSWTATPLFINNEKPVDSFFHFIPTFAGLKQEISFNYIDDEEIPQELTTTIYHYLIAYYGLTYMDIDKIQDLKTNGPQSIDTSTKYTYIKQATIHDVEGSKYYIVFLKNDTQCVCKEYQVGMSGIIQFYQSKILGILPVDIANGNLPADEDEDDNDLMVISNRALIDSQPNIPMSRVELTITNSVLDDSIITTPSEFDFTSYTIDEDTGETIVLETLPENKRRAFFDTVKIVQDGITNNIIPTEPPIPEIEGIPATTIKKKIVSLIYGIFDGFKTCKSYIDNITGVVTAGMEHLNESESLRDIWIYKPVNQSIYYASWRQENNSYINYILYGVISNNSEPIVYTILRLPDLSATDIIPSELLIEGGGAFNFNTNYLKTGG